MGNAIPKVSVVGEIAPSAEFYDYEDKYKNGTSKVYILLPLDDELSAEICNTAAKAYRALGCSGLSRVDFFVRDSDNAVCSTKLTRYPALLLSACTPCFGKPAVLTMDTYWTILSNLHLTNNKRYILAEKVRIEIQHG